MGENFTQIPNELLRGSLLTPSEKLVWIIIKSHEWNGDGCWPSATLISKESGYHRATIIRAVKALEEKGSISVKRTHGQPNQYHCATSSMVLPVASCDGGSSIVLPDQSHHATPPVASCDTNNTQEEDTRRRHKKYTRSISEQIEASRRKAEESLDALDLTKYEEKYPKINVSSELQKCKDYHLSKQANFHGPKRYTDWGRVLHTWLRNATERIDARASPAHGRKTMSQWIKEHSE